MRILVLIIVSIYSMIAYSSNKIGDSGLVVNNVVLSAGKVTSLRTQKKYKISYHVYLPTSFDLDKKLPIVIGFSPSGDGLKYIETFKESVERMGWIGVACDSLRNGMKCGVEVEREMEKELLDAILDCIPHDENRIYLNGFSGGAMRAYNITSFFQYNIAGILAHGGWLGGKEYQSLSYRENMDIAIINGNMDMGAGKWVVSDSKTLRKYSCNIRYFIFEGNHSPAPDETTLQAMKWLDEQWRMKDSKMKIDVLYVDSDNVRRIEFENFLNNDTFNVVSMSPDDVTLYICNNADILLIREPVLSLPSNYNKSMFLLGKDAFMTAKRYGTKMNLKYGVDDCTRMDFVNKGVCSEYIGSYFSVLQNINLIPRPVSLLYSESLCDKPDSENILCAKDVNKKILALSLQEKGPGFSGD